MDDAVCGRSLSRRINATAERTVDPRTRAIIDGENEALTLQRSASNQ